MIRNYNDFVEALLTAGFTMAGSADGIYAIAPWESGAHRPGDSPIVWHTGCPDTDPWEWRTRVLEERDDIAYGKLFFKKCGYVTKEWYPYFLATRRGGDTFEDAYKSGTISHAAKRVYEVVLDKQILPSHEIKLLAGFTKEEKSAFERALVELQMKMFITICGGRQKISKKGDGHGIPSAVFCTTENFFRPQDLPAELGFFIDQDDVFEKAANLSIDQAYDAIRARVLKLNPMADEKTIKKFISAKQ